MFSTRTVSVNVIRVGGLFCLCKKICDGVCFGSGRVCFYLQAVIESVLVKLQAFTINDSDEVCDEACFYHHVVRSLFLVKLQAFTINIVALVG